MANSDAARGLIPRFKSDGSPYTGGGRVFYIPDTDATAAYVGGLVKGLGTATARGVQHVDPDVSTGDAVLGVIVGFVNRTRDDKTYGVASTERYVLVCTDPDVLFEVQDDSDGGALAATDVGSVADLTGFTSGSTITGYSSIEIDASTATASGDGTEDVEIVALSDRDDNEIAANAKWLVRLNNHALRTDSNTGV